MKSQRRLVICNPVAGGDGHVCLLPLLPSYISQDSPISASITNNSLHWLNPTEAYFLFLQLLQSLQGIWATSPGNSPPWATQWSVFQSQHSSAILICGFHRCLGMGWRQHQRVWRGLLISLVYKWFVSLLLSTHWLNQSRASLIGRRQGLCPPVLGGNGALNLSGTGSLHCSSRWISPSHPFPGMGAPWGPGFGQGCQRLTVHVPQTFSPVAVDRWIPYYDGTGLAGCPEFASAHHPPFQLSSILTPG